MAGAPGALGAAAARRGQGSGTTRSLDLDFTTTTITTTTTTTATQSLDLERAVARTPRQGIARHSSNVQQMEVGELGAPILHAARRVVEEKRKVPDSVTTQPLLMVGRSVQDHPIRQRAATLKPVQ